MNSRTNRAFCYCFDWLLSPLYLSHIYRVLYTAIKKSIRTNFNAKNKIKGHRDNTQRGSKFKCVTILQIIEKELRLEVGITDSNLFFRYGN